MSRDVGSRWVVHWGSQKGFPEKRRFGHSLKRIKKRPLRCAGRRWLLEERNWLGKTPGDTSVTEDVPHLWPGINPVTPVARPVAPMDPGSSFELRCGPVSFVR